MIVLRLLLCFVWLVIIPYILGKFLIKEDENKVLYTWIVGHLLQMGVFFVLALPMVYLKLKFSTLVTSYSVLLIVLSILSLIINRKKFKIVDIIKNKKWKFDKKELIKKISIYQVIFIVLLCSQFYARFRYSSVNDDDSSFVTLSTSMIETDKMYLHDGNGNELEKIIPRKALAPISAYFSVIAKQTNFHVTVITHTVMPLVLLSIGYGIYYYLAKKLFKNKDSIFIFLIFMYLLSIFSFSVKGYNKYFLLYTWFGRAIVAAIILPFIWKVCFEAMNKEKNQKKDWLKIFTAVNAGCLCSEMAVPLLAISVGVLSVTNAIRDRKISYIFKSLLCLIPCIVVGGLYLIIK